MTEMTTRPRDADASPASPPSYLPSYLRPTLAIDGVGSAVLGLVLLAAPGWLADGLALSSSAPVRVIGVLFVLNGALNLRVASTVTRRSLIPPIAIDATFATVMLWLAVSNPTGGQTWARWLMVGAAVISADVGAVKAWGRARLAR